MDTIDPQVKNLVTAIGRAETGENNPNAYTQKGPSGEFGRYQYIPDTWKLYAGEVLGDPNAQMSIENQNKVTYEKVKKWKEQGYNPAQIASMWNAGEQKPNAYKENYRGVNEFGVQYDTPAYVENVSKFYNQLKTTNFTPKIVSPETSNVSPKYGETPDHGFVGNVVAGLLKTPARLATNLINAGQIAVGADTTQPFSGKFLGQVRPVGMTGDFGTDLKESLGAGVELGSYLIGGGEAKAGLEAAKEGLRFGKPLIPRIIKGVAEGFGIGAMAGGGKALSEDQSIGQSAVTALKTGIIGGVTGGLFSGVGAAISKAKGITPETMNFVKSQIAGDYEKALGNTVAGRKVLNEYGQGLKDSLEAGILPDVVEGRYNSAQAIDLLQGEMDRLGAARGADIAAHNRPVVGNEMMQLKNRVLDNVNKWVSDPLEKQKVNKVVDEWFNALGPITDLNKLNKLQVAAGAKAKFQNETDAVIRNAYRNIYHGIGSFINDSVSPSGVNKEVNDMLSRYHGIMDFLEAVNEKKVTDNRLISILASEGARSATTGIGAAVGGPGGAITAQVAYPTIERIIRKIFGAGENSTFIKVMDAIRSGDSRKINDILLQVEKNKGSQTAIEIQRILKEVERLSTPKTQNKELPIIEFGEKTKKGLLNQKQRRGTMQ